MPSDPVATLKTAVHRAGLLPRLLVAEALLLALVFGVSLILVGYLAQSLKTSRISEWLLLGKSTAVAIESIVDNAAGTLKDSAAWYQEALLAGREDQAQNVLDLTAQASPIFTGGVVVVGPDRRVRAADRKHGSLLGSDLAGSWPATSGSLDSGPGFLVWGIAGNTAFPQTVALAVSLDQPASGSYLVGLIGGGQSEINQILATAVRLGQSGHAELVDSGCRVLFATEPAAFLGAGEHPTYCHTMDRSMQAGIGEAATEVPETGDLSGPHVMAFVPVPELPWRLMIGTSTSEMYGPSNALRNWSIVALVCFTALAFLATTVVVQKVVEPVMTLSAIARQIAGGQHTREIASPWGGEIGELAQSLETMRRRLSGWAAALEEQVKRRTEELEQRNQELRDLYDSLRRQEAQRQMLVGKILTAQEDERRRVSRELHDSIGQAIWALTLDLERLQSHPNCLPELRTELESLQKRAAESLADLRRLTVALRPAALDDLGLVPAIRRYAELYLREAGIAFRVADFGLTQRLDPVLETGVYRIVQEAINNVARHSGATTAGIELRVTGEVLTATVVDNGRGFDQIVTGPGVGLQGMQERALLVGGTLTVTSAPGAGTVVRLEVPHGPLLRRGQDEPEKAAAR